MNKTMHLQEEAARCLLCADAPCSKACKKGDPARAIRAIRFDNEAVAGLWLDPCSDTIVYPTFDREQCIGCGRCYTSCQDGGHQAITFDADLRQPHLDGKRCVGCHLCGLVCPTGAIGVARRIAKKDK